MHALSRVERVAFVAELVVGLGLVDVVRAARVGVVMDRDEHSGSWELAMRERCGEVVAARSCHSPQKSVRRCGSEHLAAERLEQPSQISATPRFTSDSFRAFVPSAPRRCHRDRVEPDPPIRQHRALDRSKVRSLKALVSRPPLGAAPVGEAVRGVCAAADREQRHSREQDRRGDTPNPSHRGASIRGHGARNLASAPSRCHKVLARSLWPCYQSRFDPQYGRTNAGSRAPRRAGRARSTITRRRRT